MGKDFYASAQLPWHRAMIAALVMLPEAIAIVMAPTDTTDRKSVV